MARHLRVILGLLMTVGAMACDSPNSDAPTSTEGIRYTLTDEGYTFTLHTRTLHSSILWILPGSSPITGDSASIVSLPVGKRTIIAYLRDSLGNVFMTYDTSFVVGDLARNPPPADLFLGAEVVVEFYGDHQVQEYSPSGSRMLTFYSFGATAGALDTGNSVRTANSYASSYRLEYGSNPDRVSLSGGLAWLLSSDLSRIDTLRHYVDRQTESVFSSDAGQTLIVRGLELLGTTTTSAVYLRDLSHDDGSVDLSYSYSGGKPYYTHSYLSTNWNGRPRAYAQVTFRRR